MVILNNALLFILTLFFTLILRSRTTNFNTRPYPTTKTPETPVIKSIHTDLSSNSNNNGPISGGNTLYLRGTSLIPDSDTVEITIDGKFCPINLAYSSDFQLACTVPPSDKPGKVDITVSFGDTEALCAPGVCEYNYTLAATPYIDDFRPAAILSDKSFMVSGAWLDADPYSLQLTLNGIICPQIMPTLNTDIVQCYPSDIPAGYYDIKLKVPGRGDAIQTPTSKILPDSSYEPHDFLILPAITGLNSFVAPIGGQTLTITGKGFSTDPANNKVFYEDFPCDIISSTTHSIQCTLSNPTFPALKGARPGHAGVTHRTFPRANTFAELKSSFYYIGRYEALPSTYTRLASFEIEYKLPAPFDSEVVEGYFKAPVTGQYRFMLSAEGQAELYISDVPLVYTNTSMAKIAEVTGGTEFRHFFDPEEDNQISAEISLEEGKYYLLQTFHNAGNPNHLSVGVRFSNTERNAFSAKEVISVNINAVVNRLEMILTIHDTTDDITFMLGSLESEGFKFPGDIYTVKFELAEIGIESDVVSMTFLDDNGLDVIQANATKVQYRIKFYTDPDFNDVPTLGNGVSGQFQVAPGNTVSSNYLSGSYKLAYKDKIISFDYDASEGEVEDAFDQVVGVDFATRVFKHGRSEEGSEYIIYFDGVSGVSEVTVSENNLMGGESTPTIVITVLQDDSSNDIVLPVIPPHMLRTYETAPQITVVANGFLATCEDRCTYKPSIPETYPSVAAFTRNSGSLSITLSNAADRVAADFDRVSYAGNVIKVDHYDPTTQVLTASLPLLTSGGPRILAGTHIPQVRIQSLGYVLVSSQFTETIPLTITSVKGVELSNGLVEVTIEGTGFGFSLTEKFGTAVDIAGVNCQLTSLSNVKLICRADLAVTSGPVNVFVNKVSASAPFTFKKSLSTKQLTDGCYLDITGSNMYAGTTVELVNDNGQYSKMCVPCSQSTTLIRCNTCNIPAGNYTAVITYGYPSTNPKSGVLFTVDYDVASVSPNVGSNLGGTTLTITGSGFGEDNAVLIKSPTGDAALECQITSVSKTQIICNVAENSIVPEGATVFQVLRNNLYPATCSGNCNFSLASTSTPTVTAASATEIYSGDTITLTGTLFTSNTQFNFNEKPATIKTVTATSAQIILPEIIASTTVEFSAVDPTTGYAQVDSNLKFTSPLKLTSVSPSTGSLAGNFHTLTGKGFSSDPADGLEVFVGGQPCQISQVTSTQITCKTGPVITTNGPVTVTQGDDFEDITCDTCKFTTSSDSTPIITSLDFDDSTPGLITITIQGTKLDLGTPALSLVGSKVTRSATTTSASATKVVATISNLEVGTYNFLAVFGAAYPVVVGVDDIDYQVPIIQSATTPTASLSQAGGFDITFNFDTNKLPTDNSDFVLKIGGLDCPIKSSTATKIVCTIPPISVVGVSPLAEEELLTGDIISSNSTLDSDLTFDGSTTTFWEADSQSDPECFIGIDVGDDLIAQLSTIQFYPRTSIAPSKLQGGVFEGSNDGETFTIIVDTQFTNIYEGWNVIDLENVPTYRYFRFRQAKSSGDCSFAELKFSGIAYSDVTVTNPDTVVITRATLAVDSQTVATLAASVEYRKDDTPIITGVTPRYGTAAGGTLLTITGTGLGAMSSDVKVLIDGIDCVVKSHTSQIVTCLTGALPAEEDRDERPTGELNVIIGGKGAALVSGPGFLYAERWSDYNTWGCDGMPTEGDSIAVSKTMNLLVDVSPPTLGVITVEGGLYFEDKDLSFGAEIINIDGGQLQIGTQDEPFQHKLTITLYGDKDDRQLLFGNKVLGSSDGVVDIHGTPRTLIQTTLAVTTKVGDSQIAVDNVGDWKVGDYIVISSTSLDPMENEKRKITKITDNKLTLDSRLNYVHISESETIQFTSGAQTAGIKAIVVLLSRNVVIQGDGVSSQDNYGAMLAFNGFYGDDSEVRLSFVEIRNVGQAGYDNRYAVNFQNLGYQGDSFIHGCSISSSYNRGIQVQGTNSIEVTDNILYDIRGEAIILPDGVERNNLITDNVIIQVIANLYGLSDDNAPKAVKISNPNNDIESNKVIGASFGGFHLAFPIVSQGAAFGQQVCPQGERIDRFVNNTVLSSKSSGFIIDAHYPRKFACEPVRDNGTDPFAANPNLGSDYTSLTVARAERGIQALSVGNITIAGFKGLDLTANAIEILAVANAPIGSAKIVDSLIVGKLALSKGASAISPGTAILVPESDDFSLKNIHFAHLGTAIQTIRATGSKTLITKQLEFVDVTNRIGIYRHIIEDDDGSIFGTGSPSTLVNDFPHLRVPECTSNSSISGVLVCDSTVDVRSLAFSNFPQTTIKIVRLEDGADPTAAVNFTSLAYTAGQGIPFVTGYPYWISFGSNQELVGGKIELTPLYDDGDLPITLAFANTGSQQNFYVSRNVYGSSAANATNVSTAFNMFKKDGIGALTFGDYYNDVSNKILYVAVTGTDAVDVQDPADASTATIMPHNGTDGGNTGGNNGSNSTNGTDGNNSTNGTTGNNSTNGTDSGNNSTNSTGSGNNSTNQTNSTNNTNTGNNSSNGNNTGNNSSNGTDSNNNTNPQNPGDPTPVVLPYRLWSDVNGWTGGSLPKAGQDVVISASDVVMLDTTTPDLGFVNILGKLMLSDNVTSVSLSAKKIAVRGKLSAGNSTHPFLGSATIKLTGTKSDSSLMLNSTVDVGTKLMVVTGELSLYGEPVTNIITRLAANAAKGATQIKLDGDIADYEAGDQLLIVASGSTASESETNTITSINYSTKTVTLSSGLKNFHYGASSAKTVGDSMTLDMRTEVINIQRNIQIMGTQESTLGGRILVTSENNGTTVNTGVVNMQYVSISYGGDADNARAALAITNTLKATSTSTFKENVFLNPVAISVSFSQASKVVFQHNTIYQAQQHGIRFFSNNNNVQVISNFIIGVTAVSSTSVLESSAGITIQDSTSTSITITNNIAAGCGFSCYLIRAPLCTATNFFTDNVAHSGYMGQIVYTELTDGCIAVTKFTAYRMQFGVISDIPITEIQATKLIMADNNYSVNLVSTGAGAYFTGNDRYPYLTYDGLRTISITGSYFAGVGLTDCADCYTQTATCSGRYGIGLGRFITTLQNAAFVAKRLQVLGSMVHIKSNYFENFSDSLVTGCVDNKVFVLSNTARDMIPEIITDANSIKNTNQDSLALFQAPSSGDSNCGPGGDCTLQLNTIIRDDNGLLTGNGKKPSVLFPKNAGVIDSTKCTLHEKINGYICEQKDFGLLGLQVMDDNKYSTVLSPVTVTASGGFSNKVVSYRNNLVTTTNDTQKFISLVQNGSSINVTFPGTIPREIVFEYDAMDNDAIFVTITYPRNKRALITNLALNAIGTNLLTKTTNAGTWEVTDPCGTFLQNNITGDLTVKMMSGLDCKIIFEKRNAVVLKIRFSMPLKDFNAKGLLSFFIAKIASILNIVASKIRILQIYEGSTGIITAIDGDSQGDDSFADATTQLGNYQTTLNNALANNQMDLDGNAMTILEKEVDTVYATENEPTTTSPTTTTAAEPESSSLVWLAIAIPIIVVILIVIPLVMWKLRRDRRRKYELKRLPLPQIDAGNEQQQNNDGGETQAINIEV